MALSLATPAFTHGGAIPEQHTCEGKDVSPELRIDGVPQGAKSLVLVVHDPDAPDPLVFCLRDGRLVAAVGINCPKDVTHARRIITDGGAVDPALLRDPSADLAELSGTPD